MRDEAEAERVGTHSIKARDTRVMKALCDREQLLEAFGMVGGVIPARSPKPILQNVKLVADGEAGSTLLATDLEVGIRCRVLGMKVDRAARRSCRRAG